MTIEQTDNPTATNGHLAAARIYRANATAEREAAEAEPLPNRRAMHLRSAEVWEDRARLIEDTLSMREVNEAAKATKAATFVAATRRR